MGISRDNYYDLYYRTRHVAFGMVSERFVSPSARACNISCGIAGLLQIVLCPFARARGRRLFSVYDFGSLRALQRAP